MENNFNKNNDDIDIKIKLIDNDDCFIHYQTADDLKKFMSKYHNIFTFGHICCSGKGCLIKSENGKEIKSYEDIHRIKMNYII